MKLTLKSNVPMVPVSVAAAGKARPEPASGNNKIHKPLEARLIRHTLTAATVLGASIFLLPVGQAQARDCTLHILGIAKTSPEEEAAWTSVFNDFKAAYGCTVEARWDGQWNELPQKLSAARLANETVDIVYNTGTLNATLARSGVLMDISSIAKPLEARFAPGTLAQYQLGGHTWAIPVSDTSTAGFFYNKTMFDQLGLTPPKTYAELAAIGKKIKDAKPGVQPLIQRGKDAGYWPMWYMETLAQTSKNTSIATIDAVLEGKKKFDEPEHVEALNALKKFVDDGLLDSSTLDVGRDAMRAAFLQQKAAMIYGGTWELNALRRAKPTFELGAFEFPLISDEAGVVSQHGGGADVAWSVPSFAKKEDLPMVAQFLEFISRKSEASKLLAPLNPLIPSINGVEPGSEPLAPQMIKDFAPHTITYLDWIWPTELNDVISQAIPAVMFGQTSADQAVQDIQAAFDQIRDENDYRHDWWTAWTADDWAKVTPPSNLKFEVKD